MVEGQNTQNTNMQVHCFLLKGILLVFYLVFYTAHVTEMGKYHQIMCKATANQSNLHQNLTLASKTKLKRCTMKRLAMFKINFQFFSLLRSYHVCDVTKTTTHAFIHTVGILSTHQCQFISFHLLWSDNRGFVILMRSDLISTRAIPEAFKPIICDCH